MFRRLFGGAVHVPDDPEAAAEKHLLECEQEAALNPKRAAKQLDRYFGHGRLEPFIDFKGPLHDRCLDVILELEPALSKSDLPKLTRDDFPHIHVFTDPEPNEWPTIVSKGAGHPNCLTFIRITKPYQGHRIALAGIDTALLFVRNPDLAVAFPGDTYVMLRNHLLPKIDEHFSGELTEKDFLRKLPDILETNLNLGVGDSVVTPLGYEVFIHPA